MKKSIIFITILLLLFIIGCGTNNSHYKSQYKAVGLLRKSTSNNYSISFKKLEGTMVLKLNCTNDNSKIICSLNLEEGNVKISYDINDTKTELATLNSKSNENLTIENVQKGTTYIITETSEICKNVTFTFDIK